MSAPGKQSRWGSLLSQAVAGVEARLDNMLGDEDPKQPTSKPSSTAASTTATTKPATPVSRTANDRLQERLARAVAARNSQSASGQRTDSAPATPPRSSIDAPSSNQSPRPSTDNASTASAAASASQGSQSAVTKEQSSARPSMDSKDTPDQSEIDAIPRDSSEIRGAESQKAPAAANGPDHDGAIGSSGVLPGVLSKDDAVAVSVATSEKIVASLDLYEQRINDLERALEDAQTQHQEEVHGHVEQVDALQAKLQFLAREAAGAAKRAASAAPPGSSEKKLAEKDQQIAQLMEEGQKLAGNEQKLRALIKKLRAQVASDEKGLNEQRLWRQKAEAELAVLRDSSQSSEELAKVTEESQRHIGQLRKEVEKLKANTAARDATIGDLKTQLQDESDRAKAASAKLNNQAREASQQRIKELEETVATMEIEKSLAADRAKTQATELREKADRAVERSRAVELELKGEVHVLESKLEAVRARAEEASSGAVGDAQAKLLRQIETLQTQYSVASENWQGMEASLMARSANLERERDEALRRESDMRKKARETAARAKRQEEELDEARSRLPHVQRDLSEHQAQLDALRKRAEDAESALAEARAELDGQKLAMKEDLSDKASVDRRPWLEEVGLRSNSRPASPLLSPPSRTLSNDALGLQGFSTRLRKASAPSSNGEPGSIERPQSGRRPSMQPPRPSNVSLSSGQFGAPTSILEGESIATPSPNLERTDTFDSLEIPASPYNVIQDMVSVSTIAAGPSVQLVERMSAAIRRLESEKVAAKDELARISSQRDEARAEIVALMKEAEAGRAATSKVDELEKEVAKINERYQTTLEMLGEKSELVDELRADVQDVKAMYRDLVERTIK